jgi:hypothetical protein
MLSRCGDKKVHAFLTLALDGSGQLHARDAFHVGKEPLVLDTRLDGPWNWSGCGGKDKNP